MQKRLLVLVVCSALGLLLAEGRNLYSQERDSAPEQALALGVGTFVGFAGAEVAFLHLLGSYERRLSSSLELVVEGGLVADDEDMFAAIAPALKLGLAPRNRPALFVRTGPAILGTTSGAELLVHVATGIDFSDASNGLRFEARTYVSPSHASLDLLEVILSYRFDLGDGR